MPPVTVEDMLPSPSPLQVTSCTLVALADNTAAGSVISTVSLAGHPIPSETTTTYVPMVKLYAVSVEGS